MKLSPSSFPQPGDIFQERYQIERLIGSGGFSRVYLATQTDLGRKVALKIMLPTANTLTVEGEEKSSEDASGSGGHKLAERFMQEARVVANLRGPHTVTVHDHGRTDSGLLFMVLEYVDGVALSTMIKKGGALEPRRVTHILRQTLESLQEAHAHGLLHRDIKPANIMIYDHMGREDNVKVLDFGIAKVVGERVSADAHEDLTQSGSLLGTPRYMSPEQLRAQELGPASDIYSLGLVGYEMLIGKKAIETHSSVLIIGAQLDPRPFAVPTLPHIPPRLRMIVNRMLSKDLVDRYTTTDEVLRELNRMDTGAFPAFRLPAPASGSFDMLDLMPDISDSIEIERIEEIDEQATRTATWRSLAPPLLGVGALVVILVAMLVYKNTQTPEVLPTVEPVDATELPTTVAVVEPPEDKPDKPEDKPDKPEEVVVTKMLIETLPSAAKIYVNGALSGSSPVTLTTADVAFPMNIRAVTSGGGERFTVIDSPVARLEIDLQMLATSTKAKGKPPKRKWRPRKDKPPVVTKTEPKTTPKTTPKLTIPALDN